MLVIKIHGKVYYVGKSNNFAFVKKRKNSGRK
jgi:hypothetical protein